MAVIQERSPYVRLRVLAGDRRLHVTDTGMTTSGYLAEASIQMTEDEIPILHIELEESEYDLVSDGTDAARIDIRADRILATDVQDLGADTTRRWAWNVLRDKLDALKPWLSTDEPPPCPHEDVIETPEMGGTTVPGVCVWCPQPLVKLNDEWIPA